MRRTISWSKITAIVAAVLVSGSAGVRRRKLIGTLAASAVRRTPITRIREIYATGTQTTPSLKSMAEHDSRDGSNAQRVAAIFAATLPPGGKTGVGATTTMVNWSPEREEGSLVGPVAAWPHANENSGRRVPYVHIGSATTGVFCRGNNNDVQSGPTLPFLSCRAVPRAVALVTNPPIARTLRRTKARRSPPWQCCACGSRAALNRKYARAVGAVGAVPMGGRAAGGCPDVGRSICCSDRPDPSIHGLTGGRLPTYRSTTMRGSCSTMPTHRPSSETAVAN